MTDNTNNYEFLGDMFQDFNNRARAKGFHNLTDEVHAVADYYETKENNLELANYIRSVHRGNRLMLIVGELVEAHDEIRKGKKPNELYYSDSSEVAVPKPEGYLTEMVDSFIRLGDTVAEEGLVEQFLEVLDTKLNFNSKRPKLNGKEF